MIASRLISILLLLQTRDRVTAAALAREFEVSIRTIHRDIDQLSAAGIPVFSERGCVGGFRLREGYRTLLAGVNQSEAESLFLAGLPGPAAQMGLADVMATARLKLLAALPSSMHSSAERIASRFHLDAAAWFHGTDDLPALQTVARAVWSEHLLQLRYRRSVDPQPRVRTIAPLGLVLKGGIWYLVAQADKQFRTYRVANILDAMPTEATFVRPKGFDLAAHWEKSAREYETGVYHEFADVRFSRVGLHRLDLLGPHVMQAAAQTARKPDRYGWVRCRIPLESFEFGARELLRIGDEFQVIGPAQLRSELARVLRAIAKRNAQIGAVADAR